MDGLKKLMPFKIQAYSLTVQTILQLTGERNFSNVEDPDSIDIWKLVFSKIRVYLTILLNFLRLCKDQNQ